MQWFGRSRLGLLGPSYAVMGDGTCGEAIMRRSPLLKKIPPQKHIILPVFHLLSVVRWGRILGGVLARPLLNFHCDVNHTYSNSHSIVTPQHNKQWREPVHIGSHRRVHSQNL